MHTTSCAPVELSFTQQFFLSGDYSLIAYLPPDVVRSMGGGISYLSGDRSLITYLLPDVVQSIGVEYLTYPVIAL